MDTTTGRIYDQGAKLEAAMKCHPTHEFIPIVRPLTGQERRDMHMRLFAPYGCGSGRPFKHCHHKPE